MKIGDDISDGVESAAGVVEGGAFGRFEEAGVGFGVVEYGVLGLLS